MPTLDRTRFGPASGLRRGGYVLADPQGGAALEVILIATGSEVGLAVEAFEQLSADGVGVRVVSMPSWELFDAQPYEYRDEALPPSVTARVAIELGSTFGWERYVGAGGAVIGMDTFGASAPLKHLQTKFGFTPEAVVGAARTRRAAASG
jgi:transketolase